MKLAIIGAGYMADVIARRARKLDITTYCFAWEEGAIAKQNVDYFYPVSVLDKEKIYEICKENGVDGVIAGASISLMTASYIAEKLNLLGNPIDVSTNIADKYYVRKKTKNVEGLSQIKYFFIESYVQALQCDICYPAVLKPTNSGGKDGVIFINSKEELKKAFDFSKEGHDKLIIEEYINGNEYSVETLSSKGEHYVIQITEKVNSGPPHFVELAHHQPANISYELRKKVESVMKNVLKSIEIQNGPCHSEIKIVGNDVYLIEVNGRLGGDHISYPLTELSTGYPYITGVIQAALGKLEKPEINHENDAYASVFFVTKQTAHLKDIFDKCDNEEWCYKKQKVSEELFTLEKNNGFRINYFIYYSKDRSPDFIRNIK
jgi:biotin carboxylase